MAITALRINSFDSFDHSGTPQDGSIGRVVSDPYPIQGLFVILAGFVLKLSEVQQQLSAHQKCGNFSEKSGILAIFGVFLGTLYPNEAWWATCGL